MSRARDWDWHTRWAGGGLTWYPYQIAFGCSLRYWPCLMAPSIRVHIGPFKVWMYVSFKRSEDR
jgi:hypothetical protein